MKTPAKIKLGLECCAACGSRCKECPYLLDECMNGLTADALKLIQAYEAASVRTQACAKPLTFTQAKIVEKYAACSMNAQQTAYALGMTDGNIHYHLVQAQKKTGINPRTAEGLVELLPIARAILGREGSTEA